MPYQQNAMEMYNTLEGVVVNNQLPSKYDQKLVTKQTFDKTISEESYREYHSGRSKGDAANNSHRSEDNSQKGDKP